jgi:arginyl-tRNA synthetase
MRNVFDIMQDEVRDRIAEVNPGRTPAEIDAVARTVGIGAVVFGNLASQREKDVDFEIERVTSLEGDSGPYLQYAHARCASIARKAGERVESIDGIDFARLVHDAEWAVAKRLFDLPELAVRAAEACEPHLLCHYLLQLAGDFARWYTLGNGDKSLRVIVPDDPALQRARLSLTAAVQAVLATGLGYLGIGAPDWM